jgi:NAD(P)-dependent dehydrogenase (short-subunit alcohol dehydrogenase family)
VAINYLPAEEPDAREVVALIRQAGRNAVALPGDIRGEEFCKRLVADAVHQLGGLDILVNNAARQHSVESILDLTTAELDWHFKTNLYKGIRVNAVAPGPVWTPLQVTGGQTQKNLEQFGADQPMKRPAQPAELAPAYVALAEAVASYATGQVYGVAGGKGNP